MRHLIWAFTVCQSTSMGVSSIQSVIEERGGSVVECLTRDRGAVGSSLTEGIALCPWARHFTLCLVLDQPRKG